MSDKPSTANNCHSNKTSLKTPATDCNTAFAAELHQIKLQDSGKKLDSFSNLFSDVTNEPAKPGELKLISYVAVGIRHREVEPIRLRTDGIIERYEKLYSETLTS